ncbi:unnamed protein product [Camellia sinensis]
MFANTLEARPDPGGECWQDIMKDQSMPKAIQGLMGHQGSLSLSALSKKKTDSHTSTETMEYSAKERRPFVKDFEPRPSITGYHDDDKLTEEKSFVKDIEPRPSITAYHDDDKLTKEKSFVKDFEPRPSITAYRGDDKLTEEKYFVKDFEPRPCITAYRDDNVGRGEAICERFRAKAQYLCLSRLRTIKKEISQLFQSTTMHLVFLTTEAVQKGCT